MTHSFGLFLVHLTIQNSTIFDLKLHVKMCNVCVKYSHFRFWNQHLLVVDKFFVYMSTADRLV